MEWLSNLRGTIVAVDTAPFIYFVERHPRYHPLVHSFFTGIDRAEFTAITSMLTVVEVLVQPLRANDSQLANEYRNILLGARNLTALMVTHDIAEEAARVRAVHRIRTPDAIQLATAVRGGATTFLTNDSSIKPIPGLVVLTLDNLGSKP
jgi:predicted nucleic acid-binding protein